MKIEKERNKETKSTRTSRAEGLGFLLLLLSFLRPSLVFLSIRVVFFPNWLYIILAGAVALTFWIMFSVFDQLLFFSPVFVFYLPDDAVIGSILSTITAILLGIVVGMNVFILKHSSNLKLKANLGS